ncbi:MAG: ornithine carbamoyltransferase [Spirochaetes bacterium]|nr:ornithine carbamoyltransferase [Spirochaetota bacterium]
MSTHSQALRDRKDFIGFEASSGDEIRFLLSHSAVVKARGRRGPRPLAGKTVALIFNKSSTRTRVSFETAIVQLGGHPIYLAQRDLQLGRGETVADTGRVLERYVDAVVIRTYSHDEVLDLAKSTRVPVINGLTDYNHPCQILADLLTVQEVKGRIDGLKIAFVGDFNNVANTWAVACEKLGIAFSAGCPEGYGPGEAVRRLAPSMAVSADPRAAVAGADVVYADTWVSMGQEEEKEKRLSIFKPFQVNGALMAAAKPDAIFLHCLPAHREEEVTGEVMDGPRSHVWQEAENRLHVQKALLELLMGEG